MFISLAYLLRAKQAGIKRNELEVQLESWKVLYMSWRGEKKNLFDVWLVGSGEKGVLYLCDGIDWM